jgi:Carbohydrate binding domain/Secretion system C-terminal sorting domain
MVYSLKHKEHKGRKTLEQSLQPQQNKIILMKSISNLILTSLLLLSISANSQSFSGGFNFNMPPYDSVTTGYLPNFPAHTITNADRVTSLNGHFYANGQRMRFWGVNCVAGGALPPTDKAQQIAGRMRKMGINLVRLHHLDNPNWGGDLTSLILNTAGTRSLNPITVDRLDKFISQLKSQNVYINMNLNVSRTFQVIDGVAGADSMPNFGKEVTLFDPYLETLQKEYAQQVLTHINPYTGISLANDPVMAVMEMNNENTLYGAWKEEALKIFAQGGRLMVRHNQMLDSMWNAFLTTKYVNATAFNTAYNLGVPAGGATNIILNPSFESTTTNPWAVELNAAGVAATFTPDATTFTSGAKSGKFLVTNAGTQTWHVQLKQAGLTFKKDSVYTITFKAKAAIPTTINTYAGRDNSPYTWYGGIPCALTTSWQTFTFSFKCTEDNIGFGRIGISTNLANGSFWFDEFSVVQPVPVGLVAGESFASHNIRRMDWKDRYSFSAARVGDMADFYIYLEKKHFDDLRTYLRTTLGVTALISGTNALIGPQGIVPSLDLDYIDDHAYWDHPRFPGNAWDPNNWLIDNLPMVKDQAFSAVTNMFSGLRMSTKPYTVSEYNHVAPNRYRSEMPTAFSSYASFHGCDGVMFYQYQGGTDWETDKIADGDYFSLLRDHSVMAQFPTAAYVFRNALVAEDPTPLDLAYSRDYLRTNPKNDSKGRWEHNIGYDQRLGLVRSMRTTTYDAAAPTDISTLPALTGNRLTTSTNETVFDSDKGLLQTATSKYVALTGFLSANPSTIVGNLFLQTSTTSFGAISWISLDNIALQQSAKSLLTISTKLQNTGMTWAPSNLTLTSWGSATTQMEPMTATLKVLIDADSIFFITLNPTGAPVSQIKILPTVVGQFTLPIDQNTSKTMWYAIQKARVANMPLPIDLISFDANAQQSANLVTWTTLTEKNTDRFVIERSADGVSTWQTIGSVKATGTSSKELNYRILDEAPLQISYYRLRSLDFDKKEQLSKVVSVQRDNTVSGITTLYPNPTEGLLVIGYWSSVNGSKSNKNQTILYITDILGRNVLTTHLEDVDGLNEIKVSLADLPSGTYIVSLLCDQKVSSRRIVKQ